MIPIKTRSKLKMIQLFKLNKKESNSIPLTLSWNWINEEK